MDKQVKKDWVKMLRSGKYRQGKEALAKRDNSKHLYRCCLGVLCDVMGAKRTEVDGCGKPGCCPTEIQYSYKGTADTDLLPSALADEVGLPQKTQENLACMNDIRNLSFSEIADWIDSNL